jgi:hypothetical protein
LRGVFDERAFDRRAVLEPNGAVTVVGDEASIAAARDVMNGWAAAFNAHDGEALANRWMHFPHVRFHSGQVSVWQRPEDFVLAQRQAQQRLAAAGWTRSEWDYVESIDAGPDKVHFRVQFTRYRADGTLVGTYRSLYIVTLHEGRWGIQGRSSWAE